MPGGLLLLFSLDLAHIVVTGGESFLRPGDTVSPTGFVVREIGFALACLLRFRILAPAERRASASQLLIVLALLPPLFHLHFAGRRITGDALYYYVFTRSLVRDGDVNFTNEYTHYQLLDRADHVQPTSTGHRRTIYAIGSGLLWTPFFLAADVFGAWRSYLGYPVDFSGYGPLHVNAVALGSFLFGAAGLLVIHAFLRRQFGDRLAGGAVLLLWWASFLPWYLSEQPLTSHTASVLVVALFFLLREKGVMNSAAGSLAMGLVIGLGMSVRWQNGVYLLLPGVDFLGALLTRRDLAATSKRIVLMAAGVLAGMAPQMLAWKAIYDMYLLPYPPQGTEFVRLDRPFLMNLLFSSRHGLLSWTPVFWACLAGFLALVRRHPRRFGLHLICLVLMTYVNASTGDWWAGGSFSNRRFDSLLPVFALGLAVFLDASTRFVRRRPEVAGLCLVTIAALWNGSLARAVTRGEASSHDPLSLEARLRASAQTFSNDFGFPTTWPASWLFAARFQASPGAFDLAAGKYLFYFQNNLNGVVDVGSDADAGVILDGFSRRQQATGTDYRTTEGRGRLIVSLDLPETLKVAVRARRPSGASSFSIRINGLEAGTLATAAEWADTTVEAGVSLWKRGPNLVVFEGSGVEIDRVRFERNR